MATSWLSGLLRLSIRGDRDAFSKIVEATRERLFWTVKRMVGREAVAEEILQDAYLALWGEGGKGTLRNPEAWLRRFCVNRAIDHLRREETRRTVSSLEDGFQAIAAPDQREHATMAEFEERLHEVLRSLPTRERAAFILRFIEELDYPDIADTLGTTPSTVRNQVMQARRKVETALKARGIEL